MLASAPAGGWTPASYPNPATDPVACGRPPPSPSRLHGSWVCDPDRVLTGPGADALEGVLRDVASARSPYGPAPCGGGPAPRPTPGYQVAVAVMEKLHVAGGSTPADAAAAFAAALMDGWGVGAAGCNDGTVLVLSRQDRQVSCEEGDGCRKRGCVYAKGRPARAVGMSGGSVPAFADSARPALAPPSTHHPLIVLSLLLGLHPRRLRRVAHPPPFISLRHHLRNGAPPAGGRLGWRPAPGGGGCGPDPERGRPARRGRRE